MISSFGVKFSSVMKLEYNSKICVIKDLCMKGGGRNKDHESSERLTFFRSNSVILFCRFPTYSSNNPTQ